MRSRVGGSTTLTSLRADSGRRRESGTVSVDGSFVDVVAPNAEFFFTNHQAFTSPLVQNGENASGYYYIIGERSSFSRFDQLTISYDLMLEAAAMNGMGFAHLFSDISDPSFLGNPPGPYPNSNIVGTFISVSLRADDANLRAERSCVGTSGPLYVGTDAAAGAANSSLKNKRPDTCVPGRLE